MCCSEAIFSYHVNVDHFVDSILNFNMKSMVTRHFVVRDIITFTDSWPNIVTTMALGGEYIKNAFWVDLSSYLSLSQIGY